MKELCLAIGAALIGTTFDAAANWQSTSWGMSKQQVIKATGGAATTPPKPCYTEQNPELFTLSMPYKSGQFSFEACLSGYSASGLARVVLIPADKSISNTLAIENALTSKYGQPFSVSQPGGTMSHYEWHQGGDKILLATGFIMVGTDSIPIAHIEYTPLVDSNNKGL